MQALAKQAQGPIRGRWLAAAILAALTSCSGSTPEPAHGSGGRATATGGTASGGANAGGAGADGSGGRPGVGGSLAAGGAGTVPGSSGGSVVSGGTTGGQGGGSGGLATGSGGATGTGVGGAGQVGGGGAGGVPGSGGSAVAGSSGSGGRATGGSSGGNSTGGSATGGSTGAGGSAGTGGSAGIDAGTAYHPCPTDGTPCKIMPFGDSITDGFNGDTQGGYRIELFHRALKDGKNITFVGSLSNGPATVDGVTFPHNHEGHSGWTIAPEGSRQGISTLLQNTGGTQSVVVKYAPDVILLMIGTNDAIDNYDMANAPTRLGSLIDTIYQQLPNVLIVVALPIPSRGDASKGDDTGLSDRLKTYGSAIPAVVQAHASKGKHILSVDMFTPFNPNKASLLEDQYHPNANGYLLLGDQWYSVLQALL